MGSAPAADAVFRAFAENLRRVQWLYNSTWIGARTGRPRGRVQRRQRRACSPAVSTWSPGWYRSEVRIIRNTIPAWSSESLFFNVVLSQKESRYSRATHSGATIYHNGWMHSETQMNLKSAATLKCWQNRGRPSPWITRKLIRTR